MEMTLGEKIRNARKRKMTQVELANEIGVHEMTIRRWESGKRFPDVEDLRKISEVLNVPLNELIGVEENMSSVLDGKTSVNTKIETPTMAYWGGVVDNIKKLAQEGDFGEISLIYPLLKSGCEMLAQLVNKGEKQSAKVVIHKNKMRDCCGLNVRGGN